MQLNKLNLLKENLNGRKFDMTFFSGDLTNIPQDDQSKDEEKKSFEKNINEIIHTLESYEFQPKDKIYVLPGNHDHKIFFDSSFKIEGAVNIEKNFIKIDDKLYLTGFGGSIPGYVVQSGEEAFKGYPYDSEEQIEKEFNKYIENIKQKCDQNQFIFMTHIGPDFSSTALLKHDYKQLNKKVDQLQFGTKSFNNFLDQYDKNILFYNHGHSHRGMGVTSYKSTKIINPGSLMETDSYGIIDLKYIKNEWKIDRITLELMQ